jgi:hypothetical protein
MTVWMYVDTNKQVGDKDHLRVFANSDAAETIGRCAPPRAKTINGV